MKKEINVIIKEPGKAPYWSRVPNTLKGLQSIVKGFIEVCSFMTDVAVICNEEGRLMDMDYNCEILGIDFVGPIAVVGTFEDEFVDCPPDGMRIFRVDFSDLGGDDIDAE